LARAAYKPKEYTSEEKAEWATQKQDLEQFFSSIVMRQSNDSTNASDNAEEEAKNDSQPAEAAE
jgi:hypothetical protein